MAASFTREEMRRKSIRHHMRSIKHAAIGSLGVYDRFHQPVDEMLKMLRVAATLADIVDMPRINLVTRRQEGDMILAMRIALAGVLR